ncbi:MAG: metal-dependent hydrolase [Candidatus Diapherotrites archaeon]|nr:metal-dependent hydrolase [Candidatus Diapherotrites archaeon]
MSDYKTHQAVGMLFWMWGIVLFFLMFRNQLADFWFNASAGLFLVLSFYVAMLFSIFPDIDAKETHIRKQVRGFLSQFVGLCAFTLMFVTFFSWNDIIFNLIRAVIVAIACGFLSWMFINNMKTKHRGFTHTLRFGFVSAFILFLFFFVVFTVWNEYIGHLIKLFPMELSFFLGLTAFLAHFSHLVMDRQIVF